MFIYTNPNPTDKKTGDCVIRAIAIATHSTWEKTYIDLCKEGLLMADLPNSNAVWSAYSERMMYDADASYARGRGTYARRDSMGRYASRGSYDDGYGYENNGSYNYRGSYENGYSGHEDLDRMMSEAKTDKERELIRQLKEIKR